MTGAEPFIVKAAALLLDKPFQAIVDFFRGKAQKKEAFVKLLTDASFETTLEINNLEAKEKVGTERLRVVSQLWSAINAQLMTLGLPSDVDFHGKAVSWANANHWGSAELGIARNNLAGVDELVKRLREA